MTVRAGQVRLGADRYGLYAVADTDGDDCGWRMTGDRNSEELGTAEALKRLTLASSVCETELVFAMAPIYIPRSLGIEFIASILSRPRLFHFIPFCTGGAVPTCCS